MSLLLRLQALRCQGMSATAGRTEHRRRPWDARTPLQTCFTALRQAPSTAQRHLMQRRQQRPPGRRPTVAAGTSTGTARWGAQLAHSRGTHECTSEGGRTLPAQYMACTALCLPAQVRTEIRLKAL